MWYLPLSVKNEGERVDEDKNNPVNNVYKKKSSQDGNIFTCNMFQLIKLTFIEAVKNGNVATLPGLTAKLIAKHIPKLEANIFGDLNQTQKNTR